MKAVIMGEYGELEVLKRVELTVPQPKDNELMVQVKACGLNPVDPKLRKGSLKELIPLSFPHTLGGDISGVVKAVGPQVQGFKIGDEVFFSSRLNRGGGYAEFCVVEQELVALKPRSVSHVEAASLPVVGLTAIQALRDFSNMSPGQKVLIHAGAGGVGSFAIQYAKHRGAIVFATASKKNQDYLRGLGVDHFIDYQSEDFVNVCNAAGGMDIVLESIGGLSYPRSILATKEGGSVPCIVNPPDSDTLALSHQKKIKTDFLLLEGLPAELKEIASLVDQGVIKPMVTKVLSFEEILLGHSQIESGKTQGKWVVKISE